jgi:predicted enzyme related to lactoylglutathione lyase
MMTKFVWHDLMTTDPARAAAFYAELFGATIRDGIVERDGQPVAAILPFAAPGVGSHWVPYVAVDDLDAFCAALVAAGGTVCIPPVAHPLGGRFAFVTDPERGYFSALEGGPRSPAGAFGPDELLADDVERAGAFYARLGWSPRRDGTVTWFGDHAWMIRRPPVSPAPMWIPHITVRDVRALPAGATVFVPPKHVAGVGTYCVMFDPTGAPVAAVSRAA